MATGKLVLDEELLVLAYGDHVLAPEPEHGLAVATLPLHHRDPFDRLLIAQALAAGLTIVTSDPEFAKYGLPVIDA